MSNFIIFMMYPKLLVKIGDTSSDDKFWRKLHWPMYWLCVGQWPTRDEYGNAIEVGASGKKPGTPLAGGFYGQLWCIKGDLDHMAKAWGLRHYGSAQPCICCRANEGDIPWTDGRPEATWRTNLWDKTSWPLAFPGRNLLFTLPDVSIHNFVPDVMHILHLGCYSYFFGSVLKLLTHHTMSGNHVANLTVLWGDIKDSYKDIANVIVHVKVINMTCSH